MARLGIMGVAVLVSTAACHPMDGGEEVLGSSIAAASDTTAMQGVGTDREFAELEAKVPGFGGLYFEGDSRLVVHIRGAALNSTARGELLKFAQNRIGVGNSLSLRIEQGDFTFRELASYKVRARRLLSMPKVISVDIDERRNRLVVGIEGLGVASALASEVQRLAIPANALVLETAQAEVPMESLGDIVRPMVGGLMITASDGAVCSLGFNVVLAATRYSVTASHCTEVQGGTEGTNFYQPARAKTPIVFIGQEFRDPTYTAGGACPAGRICRYSDAALIDPPGNVTTASRVATTTVVGTVGPGSRTISQKGVVAGEYGLPAVGLTVRKTGITTGTTEGTVNATCVDVNSSVGGITLLCQSRAGFVVGGGDSGSPVYVETNPGGTSAPRIVGVLWSSAGSFSVVSLIRQELGDFAVVF